MLQSLFLSWQPVESQPHLIIPETEETRNQQVLSCLKMFQHHSGDVCQKVHFKRHQRESATNLSLKVKDFFSMEHRSFCGWMGGWLVDIRIWSTPVEIVIKTSWKNKGRSGGRDVVLACCNLDAQLLKTSRRFYIGANCAINYKFNHSFWKDYGGFLSTPGIVRIVHHVSR